jgi:type IV pilus assembly protein PilM
LDIGSSKLVMAEFLVGRGGVLQLERYGMAPLTSEPGSGADASAYLVATIGDIMRQHGMRPAPLYMTISGQIVFPRYVKLPHANRDKLMQIIRYEAEQNVPFPIDEVVWRYQLLDESNPDETHVMLVAVKKESLERLVDCVLAAGLEPEIVDVAPMALCNVVRYNHPDLQGCTMILDVGARSSNLIFMEGPRIFSRSIPVAGNAVTQEIMKEFDVPFGEAEELKREHAFVAFGGVYAGPDNEIAARVSKTVRNVVTRLHAEVNRSINFYRSQQGGSQPQQVLLTGGSSLIPHTDTFFREKLKVPVEYLNPFRNIPVSPAIESERLQQDMHVLGEAAGAGLRAALHCPVEISLMPPSLVASKTFRRRQPFFAMAAAGIVLIILCGWIYVKRLQELHGSMKEMVDDRILKLDDVASRQRSVHEQRLKAERDNESLYRLVRMRTRWAEILEEFHSCMLDGMWLTAIKPVVTGGRIVQIEISGRGFMDKLGIHGDMSSIEDFRNRLHALNRFSKLEITKQSEDFSTRLFTLTAELKEPVVVK